MLAQEEGLALPSRVQPTEESVNQESQVQSVDEGEQTPTEAPDESQASTIAAASEAEIETPSTSHPPSEADTTQATPSVTPPSQSSAPAHKHTRTTTKPAVPLIPIRPAKPASVTSATQKSVKSAAGDKEEPKKTEEATTSAQEPSAGTEETPKASPPKPAPPKSWAELLRAKAAPAATQAPVVPNGVTSTNGASVPKSNSLANVLASFSVDSDKKLSLLEPRGLVNTGNLCYMNSVRLS